MVVELFRLREADVREGDVSQSGRPCQRAALGPEVTAALRFLVAEAQELLNIADGHGALGFTVGEKAGG